MTASRLVFKNCHFVSFLIIGTSVEAQALQLKQFNEQGKENNII